MLVLQRESKFMPTIFTASSSLLFKAPVLSNTVGVDVTTTVVVILILELVGLPRPNA